MPSKYSLNAFNYANAMFEHDVCIAVVLLKLKNKRKRPHRIYKRRDSEGAMNILVDRHLMDDDTKKNKTSTFFKSMAETVEKFSDVAIARTKMKIAQIVLDEEIKWAEELERKQQENSQHMYSSPNQFPMTSTASTSSSDVDGKKSQEKLF